MIGLLMVGLVGTLFYYMFDSGYGIFGINFGDRQAAAVERQEETNVERGAFLFARYCRSCHGLEGKGALERAGLPGADLNKSANHPPELLASALAPLQQRFKDTITCGRVGTQMPPWLTDNNGPLNFFQIEQLVTLITSQYAEEGWAHVVEIGNGDPSHGGDRLEPRTYLADAAGADDATLRLTDVSAITEGMILRVGLEEPGKPYELFLVTSVNKDNNTVDVDRGPNVEVTGQVLGTDAIEHEEGAEVFNLTVGLPPGSITGAAESTGYAPCGQNKAAPAQPAVQTPLADGATIEMGDNFFSVDGNQNPTLQVAADTAITATLDNTGASIHNLRIAGPDGEYSTDDDIVSDPDAITTGTQGTITINLPAGTYIYQCDFHTAQMKGEIVVQ